MTEIINGMKKTIFGSEAGITIAESRGATVAYAAIAAVLASKWTRLRVEQGQEPIAGFIG